MTRISIDPITRLEGHGKIDIFLNEDGDVANAYFQIPELRGFEKFCVGRPAEDMPNLTDRICGVCPEAHHMASSKALDDLWHVDPPPTAKKLRELMYSIFYATDHTTHFYALGAPDFIVGPEAPVSHRPQVAPNRSRTARARINAYSSEPAFMVTTSSGRSSRVRRAMRV